MEAQVSAVITTYKRDEKFLERAIQSVINQSYKNIELLVVDDNGVNSHYNIVTKSIMKKYKNHYNIHHIEHIKNAGAQRARNTGIAKASGEYIAFLDDDDVWLENKIEEQLKVFKHSKVANVGLVYCWYNVLTEQANGDLHTEERRLPVYPADLVLKELLRTNYIASTSFPLIKKDCFKVVGTFDERLEASQDYDMWVRIAQTYGVDCAQIPLVQYYKHVGERITSNPEKKARAERLFLQKYYNEIKHDKVALADKNKKIGLYLMRTGKGKLARKHFIVSMTCEPTNIRLYKYFVESYVLQYKLKR